jgi:hypothetical protein
MTKPKIFQDIDKKSLKENEKNSNDENIVKQLMRVTYNENIKENNINNSIITVPNYIKYLGGSFKIDNISQSQSLDNTTYEYHLIRKRIKEIIKIFKKHLENKDHPITIIISIFEKYFTNYLTKKKIFLKNNNYFGIENFNNYIIKELHSFILICQSTLKLMYSKSFDLQCLSEEKDNSLLNINADELMNIFIYIIIKSQMPELLIHNKIISEFTTRTTQQSTMGYYFITLEAAIVYIQNDLFKQMNLYNEYDELIHKNKNILDSDNDIINTSKQKK